MSADFKMPPVSPLLPVLVSSSPDFINPIPVFITRVRSNSIDGLGITQDGFVRFTNCWHKDDPKVRENRDQILSDTMRGVFDLIDDGGERRFAELDRRIGGLEAAIEELGKRLKTAKGS